MAADQRFAFGQPRAAGLPEERYLKDENGGTRRPGAQAGEFRATAAEWEHAWRGLDPRR